MSQIPIKNSESIEFGKSCFYDEAQIFYGWFVISYNSKLAIASTSSTHPWVQMLNTFRSCLDLVRLESFDITGSSSNKATLELFCLNIGRLAREKVDGSTYLYKVSAIEAELLRKLNGAASVDTDNLLYTWYKDIAIVVAGASLEGFIGRWNSTKYKPADDILAGAIIILCWVMFWWTGFLKSWKKLHSKIGAYATIDGVAVGSFQPLQVDKPDTFYTLLLAVENLEVNQWGTELNNHAFTWKSTGQDLFGLSLDTIDNSALRAVDVSVYSIADAFWDKLLTRTEWQWKFGKSISWDVVFLPQAYFDYDDKKCIPGDATAAGDGTVVDVDYFSDFELFNAITTNFSNNWRWFNSYVNDTISAFKSFPFQNKSFAKIKSLFDTIHFCNIKIPPSTGIGGLLVHQFAHWADGGANVDVGCFKGLLDTGNGGHTVLANRRRSSTNYRFMTLGDVSIEDYRLFNYLTAVTNYSLDEGSSKTAIGNTPPLMLTSAFGFVIEKEEDLPYKINRRLAWLYAGKTKDMMFEYVDSDGDDVNHSGRVCIPPRTWVNSEVSTTEFPVSLAGTKVLYYEGRASDPYKKLKHNVHDVNNLDADLIRKDVLKTFFPLSSSSVESSPMQIASALPKPDGEMVEKPTDPVDTQKLQPVSSLASAQKDLTQANKEVTKAEKEVAKEKAKEEKK